MTGIRQRLNQGELVLGQLVLEFFTPGLGPMLDACGLDFVIFDMEHGRCDIPLLAELIASCRGSAIFPIARPAQRLLPASATALLPRHVNVAIGTDASPSRHAAHRRLRRRHR